MRVPFSTGTRAGDADRNRTIEVLANAFSAGQLTQPEYEERSSAALQAPTLAELRTLTRDLQVQPELVGEVGTPALPPTHETTGGSLLSPTAAARLVSWLLRLMTVAVVIGLIAFGRWLFGGDGSDEAAAADRTESSTTQGGTTIPPLEIPGPPDMLTADAVDAMVDAMRREIGSTTVTSLHLQDGFATFDMQRPGTPGTYDYHYDGFLGVPSHDETGTREGPPVDLASIDTRTMERLTDGLPGRLGIADVTARYITLEFDGRKPRLRHFVGNSRESGWIATDLAGRVVETYRP